MVREKGVGACEERGLVGWPTVSPIRGIQSTERRHEVHPVMSRCVMRRSIRTGLCVMCYERKCRGGYEL